MKNEQNARIFHDICFKKYFSRNFWGQFPALKLRVSRLKPQHQLRHHGGHRSTGAVVVDELFMGLLSNIRYFTVLALMRMPVTL